MELNNAIECFLQQTSYPHFTPCAVYFDMDGVLYNSMPFHAKAWVEALREEGVEFSEYQVYLNEGRTGHGTIDGVFSTQKGRNATEEEKLRIYKRKSEIFDAQGEAPTVPGILEVMEVLKQKRWTACLVTGSGQPSLLQRLQHSFPGVFRQEYMVTAFDVTYGKPHPEPYLMAQQKTQLKPWQAFVVENAPLGVKSAKAAGLFTIAVNTGILKKEDLENAGADIVLDNMHQLAELMKML